MNLSKSKLKKQNKALNLNIKTVSNNEEKKVSTRRTTRINSNRKNHISCESILSLGMYQEPYSKVINQIEKENVFRQKPKKKKKDKNVIFRKDPQESYMSMEFSKSNSLIVFSEKESTIKQHTIKKRQFIYSCTMTRSKAAIIIQKHWKGYMTRRLLEHYIQEEQPKLRGALINYRSNNVTSIQENLPSKQTSRLKLSNSLSSINQSIHHSHQILASSSHPSQQQLRASNILNASQQPSKANSFRYQTQNLSSSSRLLDCSNNLKQSENTLEKMNTNIFGQQNWIECKQKGWDELMKGRNKNIKLCSEVISYSFCNKLSISQQFSLQNCMCLIQKILDKEIKELRQYQKNKLQESVLTFECMMSNFEKIKGIYEHGCSFLQNVHHQIEAVIHQMQSEAHNIGSFPLLHHGQQAQNKKPLKSECFFIQSNEGASQDNQTGLNQEDNQTNQEDNQMRLNQEDNQMAKYSEGQAKLQRYMEDLLKQHNQSYFNLSQLQFLCEILKRKSENQSMDIADRCFIQFTVEIITENHSIYQVYEILSDELSLAEGQEWTEVEEFVLKWIHEMNKWEMGTIQEVTQVMESSSFLVMDAQKHIISTQ